MFSRLHQLITDAWKERSTPQAWKDASIVTIYKKGVRIECGNYRGIYHISITGKIWKHNYVQLINIGMRL